MKTKDYWRKLRDGHILGIVDSYGSVDSVFTGDKVEFHAEHFGLHQCQWRWNNCQSLWWISSERRPTEEQEEAILRHLTKKYGLQFWENGHHDIDHLREKCKQEEQNEKTTIEN